MAEVDKHPGVINIGKHYEPTHHALAKAMEGEMTCVDVASAFVPKFYDVLHHCTIFMHGILCVV